MINIPIYNGNYRKFIGRFDGQIFHIEKGLKASPNFSFGHVQVNGSPLSSENKLTGMKGNLLVPDYLDDVFVCRLEQTVGPKRPAVFIPNPPGG